VASTSANAAADQRQVRLLRRIGRRLRILCGLLVLILVLCPIAIWLFERHLSVNITSIGSAYQWLGRTLFETSSAYRLHTGGGYVVYYIVRIAGVSLVAFGTGAIASRLVTTVILKGKGMGSTRAKGHVLICGWSSKGFEIVRELRAKEVDDPRRIVVLARHPEDPTKDDDVEFLRGDPADADDLRRAGLEQASVAIILADESDPAVTAGDKDARTLLTCLAVESICPDVYSCVEVVLKDNRQHFARTKVNEMVVSAELTGALLGGAARTPGLSRLVTDLVTHPAGQEFYRMRVPPELVGEPLPAALSRVKSDYEALLIGFVNRDGDGFDLNPSSTRVLSANDVLLVISANADALAAHAAP
jgi:voltage-gated potassium channel